MPDIFALRERNRADLRTTAAASVLAQWIHRMRNEAFPELPDVAWSDLSTSDKHMFVEHAHALLMRLRPIAPRPAKAHLRIVETSEPEGCIYCGCIREDDEHAPYCSQLCAISAEKDR